MKTHAKRDWSTSSNIINYYTLNNEHNWENLCIQLRNQQTSTSSIYNQIKGNLLFLSNLFLQMFHRRFANASQFLLCKPNK